MSVQAEIDRIKNAKTAISTAIASKGVTVPDATLLDGMAALIAAIEAGVDGKEWFALDITPAENVNSTIGLDITHNLGFVPAMICVFDVTTSNVVRKQIIFQISLVYKRLDETKKFNRQSLTVVSEAAASHLAYSFITSKKCFMGINSRIDTISEAHGGTNSGTVSDVTENTLKIGRINGYANEYNLIAGRTYRVIIGGIA